MQMRGREGPGGRSSSVWAGTGLYRAPGEAEELLRMERSSVMLLADAESSSSSPAPEPPASRSTALLYKLRMAKR